MQLVVDRKEDPLTPLLCHWTYQAMIHQYAPNGIVNNLVNLRGQPGACARVCGLCNIDSFR